MACKIFFKIGDQNIELVVDKDLQPDDFDRKDIIDIIAQNFIKSEKSKKDIIETISDLKTTRKIDFNNLDVVPNISYDELRIKYPDFPELKSYRPNIFVVREAIVNSNRLDSGLYINKNGNPVWIINESKDKSSIIRKLIVLDQLYDLKKHDDLQTLKNPNTGEDINVGERIKQLKDQKIIKDSLTHHFPESTIDVLIDFEKFYKSYYDVLSKNDPSLLATIQNYLAPLSGRNSRYTTSNKLVNELQTIINIKKIGNDWTYSLNVDIYKRLLQANGINTSGLSSKSDILKHLKSLLEEANSEYTVKMYDSLKNDSKIIYFGKKFRNYLNSNDTVTEATLLADPIDN